MDRGGPPRPRGMGRPGRPRYVPRRKVCFFCANKNEVIDYKNPDKLRSYMSERAKIEPRRRSGTCARHQRALSTAIKRARHLALLPFVPEHVYPSPQPMLPLPSMVPPPAATVQPAAAATAPATPPAAAPAPAPAPRASDEVKGS